MARRQGILRLPLIYASQVVNAVLLPSHVVALQLLASDTGVVGHAKPSRLSLGAGWIGVVLIIACVFAFNWAITESPSVL